MQFVQTTNQMLPESGLAERGGDDGGSMLA
jgi:hypothetical protein